jgi:hypothetical protein
MKFNRGPNAVQLLLISLVSASLLAILVHAFHSSRAVYEFDADAVSAPNYTAIYSRQLASPFGDVDSVVVARRQSATTSASHLLRRCVALASACTRGSPLRLGLAVAEPRWGYPPAYRGEVQQMLQSNETDCESRPLPPNGWTTICIEPSDGLTIYRKVVM